MCKKTRCKREGCTNNGKSGGFCILHGARCSHEGCTNEVINRGLCIAHGAAKGKRCTVAGCANGAVRGGVCCSHGAIAMPKLCSHGGCTSKLRMRGVWARHGAKSKRCSIEGCTNGSRIGGLCCAHGAISTAARNVMARSPNPAKGYKANAVITSAISIRVEEININPRNLQASISCATSRESPSLRPSTMPQNFSDDDDEICSWIYRTSRMSRLAS